MLAALALLLFFGSWEAYCALSGVDPIVLPPPSDVAQSLVDHRGLLLDQLAVTAREMGIGMVVALVAAGLAAVAMHQSPLVRRALYPLLIASQTIPIPALAPLLVFWWGFGILPKVFVIGLICFFPVLVAVLDRLRNVDPGLIKLMRTFGATRWQTLKLVEGPAALPGLFTGLKLCVAVAAIAAVLAEGTGVTTEDGGLGVLITRAQSNLDTALSFAAVGVLSVLSLLLFGLVALLERVAVPWAIRKDPPQ